MDGVITVIIIFILIITGGSPNKQNIYTDYAYSILYVYLCMSYVYLYIIYIILKAQMLLAKCDLPFLPIKNIFCIG